MKTLKTLVKSKFLSTVSNYSSDEKGNFAIIGAVTVAMLVGGLAIGVDVSNGYFAKQRLQDTTDNIALMAARGDIEGQANLNAVAQEYFEQVYPGGTAVNLESITRDGDAVTVIATNTQPTYFSNIFGRDGLDVKVSSTAVHTSRNLNLALVLDSTGSMSEPTPTGGTRLTSLKRAGNDLIDQLGTVPADQLNVSVVPFAAYVNVGTNMSRENWIEFPQTGRAPSNWDGCVGSRQAPLNTRIDSNVQRIPGVVNGLGCALTEVQPLTRNMNAVKQTINALQAKGSTYTPAGIAWGWRTLTPTAPFAESRNQNHDKTDNVMVIVTDGNNTRSKDGITHHGKVQSAADQTMATMCENAKRDDIEIYTIALEIKDNTTLNLLRGCASERANFFDASNGDELGEAFSAIAVNLTGSRISS